MVIFLYREAYYAQEGETVDPTSEVIVAKNRNGPTGKVDLIFFKEYARFENNLAAITDTASTVFQFIIISFPCSWKATAEDSFNRRGSANEIKGFSND